jgi:phosphoglycerol transferase MdoB-like AlkP superfamily enzyme
MSNKRIYILAILGAVFFFLGLYYRVYDPAKSISYEYLGIGTWLSGLIFYLLIPKYKEVTSLVLGLLILHAGVILLLIEKLSNPKLLGFLVFTAGLVVVLNSGFSDYMKRRKSKK